MAQSPVEGKLIVLLLDTANTGASYDLVVCQTGGSFERTSNVIDANSKCGTAKLIGVKDRTIQIDGIIMKDPDLGNITEGELNNIFEGDTKVAWLWGPASPGDGDIYYTGVDALISSVTYTAPLDGAATFSATFQLNGVPVQHEGSGS